MTRLLPLLLAGLLLVGCTDSFVGAEDVGDIDRTQPDKIQKDETIADPGDDVSVDVATSTWDTPGDPNQTDTSP